MATTLSSEVFRLAYKYTCASYIQLDYYILCVCEWVCVAHFKSTVTPSVVRVLLLLIRYISLSNYELYMIIASTYQHTYRHEHDNCRTQLYYELWGQSQNIEWARCRLAWFGVTLKNWRDRIITTYNAQQIDIHTYRSVYVYMIWALYAMWSEILGGEK